jgi:hypothetical protein
MAVHLGNHWLKENGDLVSLDDTREPLPRDVDPGEDVVLTLRARAPELPGRHLLEVDMVQEGVSWFGARGSPTARVPIEVRAPSTVQKVLASQ